MDQIGQPLFPWQAEMVIHSYGVRRDGQWAAKEVVGLLPRQNGKGGFTEAQELGGLFLLKEKQILHSAHLFPTALQAFQRLVNLIDGCDWLRKRVRAVARSKGSEGIYLTKAAGGGELLFVARTTGGARGFTGTRLVFDEAYALTAAQFAAQTPTLATITNYQITYTSTPPDDETGPMPEDAMLPSVRKRGMAGDPEVFYAEWSPPRGADPADVDVWYDCNPSLGIKISEEFLASQYRRFAAASRVGKFSTEHLGDWPPSEDEQWLVIPESAWETAGDPDSKAEGGVALAISMREDRLATYIGFCGRRADGQRHVSLKERIEGSAQVVPTVQALIEEREGKGGVSVVVIGAGDPARSLLPDFKAAGIEVITPSSADVSAECGAVHDAIAGTGEDVVRDLHHPCNPVLTAAMAAAMKKNVGKLWVWAGADSAPLFAITNAAYGFRVRPPDDYDVLDSVY